MIRILSDHKGTTAWLGANLTSISPTICMQRIQLEDNVKPARQLQCRLNPHIKEVVHKELVKFLDAGIMYLISNSKWVSPVQVVRKKSCITMVKLNSY